MRRDKGKPDRGEIVSQAFRAAYGSTEPDVSRIKEAFPGMIARAASIRAARVGADPLVSLGLLARKMVPRFAAAAALLVLAAVVFGHDRAPVQQTTDVEIDTLILTGEVGDSVSDILLDAVSREGANNG